MGIPDDVAVFSRRLAETLAACCADRLVGAYLHGSAAFGGWLASRSDVDLLLVLEDSATAGTLSAVEQALLDSAEACPGTGLECSAVSYVQASAPRAPWPFLLHVHSSRGEPAVSKAGASMAGDPDLLMHYAVCRAVGVSVLGAEAPAVFGPVHREDVLAYLSGELDWGLAHGSDAYAVLNACRALVYATQGEIVSKLEGGRRALEQGWAPRDVVTRALAEQRAIRPVSPVADDSAAFVRLAIERLHSAG